MRQLMPVVACIVIAGCARTDAETEIRDFLDGAEAAAEERRTGFFRNALSDNYVDRSGRRKDMLVDQIRGYFFVNQSIELIKYVDRVELDGETAADVTVRMAVLGGRNALTELDADFYRIDLELERIGGDWQIIGADWGRASE
jgi:hypothetical protein